MQLGKRIQCLRTSVLSSSELMTLTFESDIDMNNTNVYFKFFIVFFII